MQDPIIIVGGGLSGLHAASLLVANGVSCRVLEAQERIGGRVLTKQPSDQPELGKFDLGPTWFWPQYEPVITNLVETFGLKTIVQPTEGAVLLEQSPNSSVQRGLLPAEAIQKSVRLAGGMQALIDAIQATLPPGTVELNTRVTAIHKSEEGKAILRIRTNGQETTTQAGAVIMALPPHIIANHIDFSPPLSDRLMTSLRNTPTWMAEQAKAIAIYDRPFWREDGLSGQAMSWGGGPLQEIHDASPDTGYGALFGFFSLPARNRRELGEEHIRQQVISQLTRLFGPAADKPLAFLYKDWSNDPGITGDLATESHNALPAGHRAPSNDWGNRIILAGTETSSTHGGHLEGALRSAEHAVSNVL